MRELIQEVRERLSKGEKVALARVVEVIGSTVRPAGAAVAVCGDEVIGSVSGGCVEGAVVEEARAALVDGGKPRIRTFGCSEDEVFGVGLTCGGVVRVLVESFDPGDGQQLAWLEQLLFSLGAGRGAALLEVIDGPEGLLGWKGVVEATRVPTPAGAGAIELASSGGEVPGELANVALADLSAERSVAHRFRARHEGRDVEVTVFVDALPVPPTMVIIGAASFTAALTVQAKLLGFRVVVCDARPVFATAARFPAADEVVAGSPQRYLHKVGGPLGWRDAVCILSHDPKFDVPAIVAALATQVGYIGVMGSRRTQEDRKRRLREAGVSDLDLERLHGPIGLDLGATSPAETAVSVVADIVATRNRRSGRPLAVSAGPIHSSPHTQVGTAGAVAGTDNHGFRVADAKPTTAWAKHLTDDGLTVDELRKAIGPLGPPDRPGYSAPPRRPSEQWFEELSKTEARVLRFLPTNMTAPEIAQELYLSVHTVKMHIRHIYSKLGVHRRGEAVKRASTLGLLWPSLRAAPIPA